MDFQNLTKKQKIILCTLGLLVILVISASSYLKNTNNTKTQENKLSNIDVIEVPDNEKFKYVEITGQVTSPGVYEIETELMIIELINLAGGLTDYADLEQVHKDINLSALVEDRQKVYIPALSEYTSKSTNLTYESAGIGKLNLNSATLEELDSLPDIGPATADKIINARPFSNIEELKDVEGIGEKTYNNLVSKVTL